ncbi:MAG TPA: hypothetical protein VN963_03820, partial [bacterium]|nr:hypothetical protein [bacterium]
MKENDKKIKVGLQKIHFFRLRAFIVGLLYMPFAFLVIQISRIFTAKDDYVMYPIFAYFLFFGYCMVQFAFSSECPKCHR